MVDYMIARLEHRTPQAAVETTLPPMSQGAQLPLAGVPASARWTAGRYVESQLSLANTDATIVAFPATVALLSVRSHPGAAAALSLTPGHKEGIAFLRICRCGMTSTTPQRRCCALAWTETADA
jgi:hypothetical protein